MSFVEIVQANVVCMLVNVIFYLWSARILLGRVPDRGRVFRGRAVFFLTLFISGSALLGTVCYTSGMFRWRFQGGQILFTYVQQLFWALILRDLYREQMGVCWITAIFTILLSSFGGNFSLLFAPYPFFHLDVLRERLVYLLYMWVLSPLCQVFLMAVLYKIRAGELYRCWLDKREKRIGAAVFLSAYPILEALLLELSLWNDGESLLAALSMLLAICMIFVYAGRADLQQRHLEEQRVSLQQQTVYIQTLEGLQRETRKFRHDFKNMMAGMYVQAEDGNLEAVRAYIQEMTDDFGRQVDGQLRQISQLANIQMPEVKGLLLAKLDEMKRKEIPCRLEVEQPFSGTRMRRTDLCRCLGILLDNAVEETEGRAGSRVEIMVSSRGEWTVFRIKNTLHSRVDFHRIGQAGYSSKGEGRGIGLASCRAILEQYDFVFSATAVEEGWFVQEIKIQEAPEKRGAGR